jgi:hypothetical protein
MRQQPNYTWMLKNLLKLYYIWTWDTLWCFACFCFFWLFSPLMRQQTELLLRHHLQDWRLRDWNFIAFNLRDFFWSSVCLSNACLSYCALGYYFSLFISLTLFVCLFALFFYLFVYLFFSFSLPSLLSLTSQPFTLETTIVIITSWKIWK